MSLIETVEYRGHAISVYYDDCPQNPRTDYDQLGTMVCWHRRYQLGDEMPGEDPTEWIRNHRHKIMLPLYLYDHSGITMSTGAFSCPWDSGQVGYIYMPMKEARKNWKGTTEEVIEKATACLQSEVREYDYYLTGQVYGYMIEGGCEDSCWGFIGEHDYMIKEARSSIDCYLVRQKAEREKLLKIIVRNRVPLHLREAMLSGYKITPEENQ